MTATVFLADKTLQSTNNDALFERPVGHSARSPMFRFESIALDSSVAVVQTTSTPTPTTIEAMRSDKS